MTERRHTTEEDVEMKHCNPTFLGSSSCTHLIPDLDARRPASANHTYHLPIQGSAEVCTAEERVQLTRNAAETGGGGGGV